MTLRDWNEQMWLTIFDRSGNFFGRTSDRGILQRFNERMDFEYHLDAISYSYTMAEVYDWYRKDSGARFWAGSINHLQLIQGGDFKASVPLGETWAADAWFRYEKTLEADRDLVTFRFRHQMFSGRGELFALGTILPIKPEADLEFGFNWSTGGGVITGALGALDVFSDFIYQNLEVPSSIADTTIDYTAHPFTGRVALDLPLGRRFRLEGYALAMTPTTIVAETRSASGAGFEQDERFAYTGGLLEWAPSRRSAFGAIATWARARLDRTPRPGGQPEDDFDLRERTWRLGFFGRHRFSRRFELEARLAREWRTEERTRPDATPAPNLDYEDRALAGHSTLTYRAGSGFHADLGLDLLLRDILKSGEVPGVGSLDNDNARLRLGLGWAFDGRAFFLMGASLDLDDPLGFGVKEKATLPFDGAYGRFSLYW